MSIPAIPACLAHRPTHAGRVVPYITACHLDRPEWGTNHPQRLAEVLAHRLCQICGTALDGSGRTVVYARPADFALGVAPEPGMHPECATYSHRACPMLAALADHYSRTPWRRCDQPGCGCRDWKPPRPTGHPRLGAAAETWYAVWMHTRDYRLNEHRPTGVIGPVLAAGCIVRVRKVREASVADPQARHLDLLLTLHDLYR
ncbi:hypothetical protein [Nocardia farcinica]